jgi:hypothetical protein
MTAPTGDDGKHAPARPHAIATTIPDGIANVASPAVSNTRTAAGPFDLARLLAQLGAGKLRGDFDAQAAGCRWARALTEETGAAELRIGVLGRGVDLVTTRTRSEQVLSAEPETGTHEPGRLKAGGMAFLAPAALAVASGERWHRLRAFNEQVLATRDTHPFAQHFLETVRAAFDSPVTGPDDVRRALGRAMVGIVLGEPPADGSDPADDARVLFDVVQNPVRRKLLGFRYRGRRDRLYALIERRWQEAGDADRTLIALARRTSSGGPSTELFQQVPHWMFTFTGSGSALLTRTLAMITARPAVRERVSAELAAAGPPERAETIQRLDFLNACLLETGRLFPPVTRTFHHTDAKRGAGREIVHYFPLLQRDDTLGPSVHHFVPERWLQPVLDPPAAASNLFLRGPRACPGSDLILFVCRAAAARLIGELRLSGSASTLSRDPLPLSFPERTARFTTAEVTP